MNSLGFLLRYMIFGHEIEESLKERFEQFDKTAEYNQLKVLDGNAEKSSKCRVFSVFFRIWI